MSIHPLNDIDSYKAKLKPSEILKNALRFGDEDLASNQDGKMSTNQRLRCLNRRTYWLFGTLLCLIGSYASWSTIGGLNLLLLAFGTGLAFCGMSAYRLYKDATTGIVASVEGRITLNINGRRFSIMLEGKKFDLKQQAFLAFKNGDPYRIYFSAQSKMLLSAEWLRD